MFALKSMFSSLGTPNLNLLLSPLASGSYSLSPSTVRVFSSHVPISLKFGPMLPTALTFVETAVPPPLIVVHPSSNPMDPVAAETFAVKFTYCCSPLPRMNLSCGFLDVSLNEEFPVLAPISKLKVASSCCSVSVIVVVGSIGPAEVALPQNLAFPPSLLSFQYTVTLFP